MNASVGPIHYRYEIIDKETGVFDILSVDIVLNSFAVVAETPAGYWLTYCGCSKDHWVSKDSMKRWAYPSKKEAIVNFLKRKNKYVDILRYRLERTEAAMSIAQGILDDRA